MSDGINGFGGRLVTLRKARGFTQQRLASMADCSRESLSQYEHGQATPGGQVLADLAKALGVSITYLLLGEEEAPAVISADNVFNELDRINRRTTELLRRVILFPKETADIHSELQGLEERAQAIRALLDLNKAASKT
jgi:transcriptional regulator with XRE-family HTH domain